MTHYPQSHRVGPGAAFRQLTIIRLARFIGLIIWRGCYFIITGLYRIIGSAGSTVLNYVFELKHAWRSESRRRRPGFFRTFAFGFLAVRRLPRAAGGFWSLSRRALREEAHRAAVDIKAVRPAPPRPLTRREIFASAAYFFLWLVVLILPLWLYAEWRMLDTAKDRALGSAEAGLAEIFTARESLAERDFEAAGDSFTRAGTDFLAAQQEIGSISSVLFDLARYAPHQKARLAGSSRHLLAAGELSASLGARLTAALTPPSGEEAGVQSFLEHFLNEARPALGEARRLERELGSVKAADLPEEYRASFEALSEQAVFLSTSLETGIDLAERALIFVGQSMDKRYMLVFQNNAERRGAGGFVGSFALIDVSRGAIKSLVVPAGGSYDVEAGVRRLVIPPEPLRLLRPAWYFWDANWWPDWPTSARQLMRFYENSGGSTVDGVISFTPAVFERLLEAVGPIDMTEDYGVVVTSANVWTVMQTFSEQKPDVTVEPKKIIGDLMNRLMTLIPERLSPEFIMSLIDIAERSLNEKHILAYFSDPAVEETVKRLGWSGQMRPGEGDYLMVVNSNIGGQKTDRVIRETIDHEAVIRPDGSILINLTVTREHPGIKGEAFTGARNVNWLRVYVPHGSRLIAADGFAPPDALYFKEPDPRAALDPALGAENHARVHASSGTKIYEEAGATVFANWSMIDPGHTAVLHFTYELPFTVEPLPIRGLIGKIRRAMGLDRQREAYTLRTQKQPGADNTTFRGSVVISSERRLVWHYPAMERTGNRLVYSAPFETDLFAAFLFEDEP